MLNEEMIDRFKSIFEEERKGLLYSQEVLNEDFNIQKDDLLDESDLTSSELEQSMRLRLRNRESLYLKKITKALKRIDEGSFGECEECNEMIEMKRLEARPTTTLCLGCKEDEERKEVLHIDGHRSKSLGSKARFA